MIAANKRFIKADLTRGVLNIQQLLITLYIQNMNSCATQAALVCGFSFNVMVSSASFITVETTSDMALYVLYFASCTLSFLFGLMVLGLSTVVVMFGPAKALKSEREDAVKEAAEVMRKEQRTVFFCGGMCVFFLLLGSVFQAWAMYNVETAIVVTILLCIGGGGLFWYIRNVFNFLTVDPSIYDALGDKMTSSANLSYDSFFTSDGSRIQGSTNGGIVNGAEQLIIEANNTLKTLHQNILWRRTPIEDGGTFKKCYAVVQNGFIDFYASEKDYINNAKALNKRPVSLTLYYLETNQNKFSKNITSLRSAVKSVVLGNKDFGVKEILRSDADLAYASANFKFALVPKMSSELYAMETIEFLAHEEQLHNYWTKCLSTVLDAAGVVEKNATVHDTVTTGANMVEFIVRAANTDKKLEFIK